MDHSEISITQALNQVQSWLNAKEYDKVVQACQEILEIEPENQRALSLLKQAETQKYGDLPASPGASAPVTPAPAAPTPAPAAVPNPTPTPEPSNGFAKLTDSPEAFESSPHLHMSAAEKRKLFLAVLIPALLVILIGGLLIWFLSNRQREKEIEETATDEVSDSEDLNPNYEARNDRRTEDLENIALILENYQQENGSFPSVSQVEDVLLSSGDLDEIPLDPKHGEKGKNDKVFGYIYAVYEDEEENDVYVLSGLFEDSQGMGSPWTQGGDIQIYTDYRDLSEPNVHLLGDSKTDDDEEEDEEDDEGPKVKVRR